MHYVLSYSVFLPVLMLSLYMSGYSDLLIYVVVTPPYLQDRGIIDLPITNLRDPGPMSPIHKDYSDNEADSPRFQTKAYHRQTRRKI